MSRDDEHFRHRSSHIKTANEDAAAPLPPEPPSASGGSPYEPAAPDSDSDFSLYLDEWEEEDLKCKTLKKLFHSLEFNVMDGVDVYIDDYS